MRIHISSMAGHCVTVTTAGWDRLLCKQGQLKQPTPVCVPLGKKTWPRGYNTHRMTENLKPPQTKYISPCPNQATGCYRMASYLVYTWLQTTHFRKLTGTECTTWASDQWFGSVTGKGKDLGSRPSFIGHACILPNRCSA